MVSTLDVAPTILEIAGLPPLRGAQGKSLFPLIRGSVNAVHEYIFAEQDILEPLRSVRNKKYKLIRHLRDGKLQLYNTTVDPDEKKDISEENPEVVRLLSIQLSEYMKKK